MQESSASATHDAAAAAEPATPQAITGPAGYALPAVGNRAIAALAAGRGGGDGTQHLARAVALGAGNRAVARFAAPAIGPRTQALLRNTVCDPAISTCPAGTVAPDGSPNFSPNASSADFQAGYSDGSSGGGPRPAPRAGQARADYDAGYETGVAHRRQDAARQHPATPPAPAADPVASMDLLHRLMRAMEHAQEHMAPEIWEQVKELLSPESLAIMAAFIAAQFVGVGEVADAIGLLLLAYKIGGDAVTVARDLKDFVVLVYRGRTDRELDSAGQHFAHAITLGGVDVLLALLAARGPREAAEGEGRGGGRGRGQGEGEGRGRSGEGEGEGRGRSTEGEAVRAAEDAAVRRAGEGVTSEDFHVEDSRPPPEPSPQDPAMQPAICFPAGTLVHTPTGPRAIELIAVGDAVWAWNEHTGTVAEREVTDTIHGRTTTWVEIEFDGAARVKSTPPHPFWVESERRWLPAGELAAGMTVRMLDGRVVGIAAVSRHDAGGAGGTFNLSVDELHSFFVGDGVLVHNVDITIARFNYLNRPGYRNYVLRDALGRIYYSGMFGPGDTAAGVQYRHAHNRNRFNTANGDTFELQPGTRTYAESRIMENRIAIENNTVIGRAGDNYRGNRQQPLAADKVPEYTEYTTLKASGCG